MRISKRYLFLLLIPSLACAQEYSDTSGECQSYVAVQGFGISSLGNFKQDWKEGSGGYAGYGVIYPSQWGVIFQTGYISFRENPDANLGNDPSFTIIPLMVGGRYYILLDRVRPFLHAMSGINFINQKYIKSGTQVDEFLVKLNFQTGLGVQIGLFSNLSLEVAGNYNAHVIDPNLPYNATGLEYGIALNWTVTE